uniref:Cupin type-1 domain-containing protein n=1 Tax=Fagus sylvatica TaxID=28930 RepID=A0A2N9H7M5_FAGSY
MMKGVHFLVTLALLALATSLASAYDPSPLQDFCVAINNTNSAVFVNGKFCKDPAVVTADDFFFPGLNVPGNTENKVGFSVNLVNVDKLPGLNTLGISLARLDFAPYGLNPPHIHPRQTNALAFAGLSSQNPGVITIANAVFGSTPPINPDVLIKAFQVDKNVIDYLQKQF